VGAANTALGLLIIWTGKALGLGDVVANAVGYFIGIIVSFMLNKRWTFGFQGEAAVALLRFIGIFVVAYAANLGTVLGCIRITSIDPFWCQAFGILPYTAVLYVGSRWYVFRHSAQNSGGIQRK